MNELKLKILEDLLKFSNPYVDIRHMEKSWDIHSEEFFTVFSELEESGMIASKNTSDCGLEVGVDGLAQWSVVDLYVTDYGKDFVSTC